MIKHKTRVQETAVNKPNASTAFNLPTSAATGFRTFAAAYANADLLPYLATDGTDWESGIGTFTTGSPNTLVRTAILESSNSDAAVDFSAGADVELFVEWSAKLAETANATDVIPGGRLTLESGVPVSTSDQLAKTTLYYVPYFHNKITLWNGSFWQTIEISEKSLELGTLTTLLPYDVYGYLNNGTLAMELLAWSNNTTRATEATLQDGRFCKSGNKSRLLLGTIAMKTSTTIEDSTLCRLVANVYNKISRCIRYSAGASSHTWTPGAASQREYNNTSDVAIILFVNAVPTGLPSGCFSILNSSSTSSVAVLANLDSPANVYPTAAGQIPQVFSSFTTSNNWSSFGYYSDVAPGLHKLTLCDRVVNAGSYTLTANFGAMWGEIII